MVNTVIQIYHVYLIVNRQRETGCSRDGTSCAHLGATLPWVALLTGVSTFVLLFLSRIRERYDQAGDNTAAVASGLQRTGGLLGRANW
jgi:hypothetical protein